MYQALYRKWRPRTFDDVVGQNHITDTLKRQIQEGRLSHAYLFTGTRGTGKTTCAKILARAVNCEHPVNGNPCNHCPACLGIESGSVMDVLELDAASNNGVDQVRALRDEAVYSPAAVRKRVYIVDEVHMLSTAAFNALLKILEEPPEHLLFILATTELHKVPATIKSRCQQFAFKRISPLDITARLKYVAEEEGISLTGSGASLLARLADGGLRDALSLLDQCATGSSGGELGEREILDFLGLAGNLETAGLMKEIAERDTGATLERLDRLYSAGKDVGSLLSELAALARDMLIRKTAPRGGALLLTGGYDETTLRGLLESLTLPRLSQILGQLQLASANLSRSTNRRIDAELCLIRLCDETLDDSSAGLSARIARLEESILADPGTVKPASSFPKGQAVREPGVPPSEKEELPPWDIESPPPSDDLNESPAMGSDAMAAGAVSATAKPHREKAAEGDSGSGISPGATPTGDFWKKLVAGLRGRVPMGEYSFLSNMDMVRGTLDGALLTLWVQSEFVKNMISKPGILAALENAAKPLPGGPYRAVVTVGKPPEASATAPSKGRDKLDDLLGLGTEFGNIIIEE